jgi:hypothetical protein
VPEYDIAFGKKLSEVACEIVNDDISTLDARRTVLYLSLLSTEISLKAMLEHAGKSVAEIRRRGHQLAALLTDLGRCEIEVEVTPGCRRYVSASRLRAHELRYGEAISTVGTVIDAEQNGASAYPNQVRYGDVLSHFPAEVVVQMSAAVSMFACEHWQSIRVI